MNWLELTLFEDENVIFRTRKHIYQILLSLIIAAFSFMSIWLLIIAVPYSGYAVYTYIQYEYVLTDYRIIIKKGLFNFKIDDIYINSIDDVIIRKSLSDKVISGGTIYIIGSNIETKKLTGIAKPHVFRSAIYSQLPTTKISYYEEV